MPDSHKCERLGVSSLFGRDHRCKTTPPQQKERRRPAPTAHDRKPPTTTSEENAVTHAPAVDGTMVSRPGECGARD
ncbi:hypothetical protein ABEB36_004758 [Hypothenemus hampei]|uniref:Uncharacterized protein n=1 Tax=Hypothenemus hampei TaxID=57062 RepID=A0ABD1EVQ4_HYPHA